MTVYLKDPKVSTKSLLSLKTTFAKVAGYKIKHNKYKNTIAF
jgi:hypothetical protein